MSKGKSQPFCQGPPPQKIVVAGGGGEGVESVFREDQVQIAELHQPGFPDKALQVKVHQKKEIFSMLPEFVPPGKIHSVVKGLFSPEALPKVTLAGRSQQFFKELEETNCGQKNFGNCTGLQNPISCGSNPGQDFSQSKNEYRSISFNESRNGKHVAERCHSESVTCFRSF